MVHASMSSFTDSVRIPSRYSCSQNWGGTIKTVHRNNHAMASAFTPPFFYLFFGFIRGLVSCSIAGHVTVYCRSVVQFWCMVSISWGKRRRESRERGARCSSNGPAPLDHNPKLKIQVTKIISVSVSRFGFRILIYKLDRWIFIWDKWGVKTRPYQILFNYKILELKASKW